MKYSHLTLKDLYLNGYSQINSVSKILSNKTLALEDLGSLLPCSISLLWHGGNLFINNATERELRISKEEAFQKGLHFVSDLFDESNYIDIMNLFRSNLNEMIINKKPLGYYTTLKDGKSKYYSIAKIVNSKDLVNDKYFNQLVDHYEKPGDYKFHSHDKFMQDILCVGKLVLVMSFIPKLFTSNSQKIDQVLSTQNFVYSKTSYFLSLSAREKEIIRLWVNGYSSKEISILLNISIKTVETHRKNIYKKLEINSYFSLLKFAQAFDLV